MLQARDQAASSRDRPPQLPLPVPQTPARAAATAIGRAAERLYRLGVQPVGIDIGALTLAEMTEVLPEPSLLTIVQGVADAVGVVALCPEAVTALIEMQALGRITKRPVERRKLTRSDAMLCVEFVNALMAELATEMAGVEGFDGFSGYRYATYLDDPRPLALMLEDKPYRSLEFRLRLGATETRDARIFLALPHVGGEGDRREVARPEQQPAKQAPAVPPQSSDHRAGFVATSVQDAPIEVIGVLCRRQITLKELRNLVPGQMLPLPRVNLSAAQIETIDGQVLAVGKFGEADGCHAIRLHSGEAGDAEPARAMAAPLIAEALPLDLFGPDEFRAAHLKGTETDKLVPQTGGNGASIG
ncbi:FliM/FliN family flagellar motor switch protein [Paracoccus amoyensis]|nr:FliM/FliN family flagellar motor C-terminal domain-containing protein [Paracoccus amoyensis]